MSSPGSGEALLIEKVTPTLGTAAKWFGSAAIKRPLMSWDCSPVQVMQLLFSANAIGCSCPCNYALDHPDRVAQAHRKHPSRSVHGVVSGLMGNRLRHDRPARKVIKQAQWLLLRNPENLKKPEQQVHLKDLLAANQSLMTAYF
jgi:hypothetical protein